MTLHTVIPCRPLSFPRFLISPVTSRLALVWQHCSRFFDLIIPRYIAAIKADSKFLMPFFCLNTVQSPRSRQSFPIYCYHGSPSFHLKCSLCAGMSKKNVFEANYLKYQTAVRKICFEKHISSTCLGNNANTYMFLPLVFTVTVRREEWFPYPVEGCVF